MNNFTGKMDIIEYLYQIKENFEEKFEIVNTDYLRYVFDLIEIEIPTSKYFDKDVLEMGEDVIGVIFDKYSNLNYKIN